MADCVGSFNTHTPLRECSNQPQISDPENPSITLPECQSESVVMEVCNVHIDDCNRGCGKGVRFFLAVVFDLFQHLLR